MQDIATGKTASSDCGTRETAVYQWIDGKQGRKAKMYTAGIIGTLVNQGKAKPLCCRCVGGDIFIFAGDNAKYSLKNGAIFESYT